MVASEKRNYIDAVRGWAIIMVMTNHTATMFPQMPYPIKKLTNFGWHGVQLFFLASAVTLLMSWNNAKQRESRAVQAFFTRRFLRIAPMYYLGALIYFIAEPPSGGFDLAQLLRSFTFVNAWSPTWIPTTPGWMVVPGGWSIGVEFTFYAIFPLLATLVTTFPRACALFIASLAGAFLCNHLAAGWMANYDESAGSRFLYFWFPNQFPVFALGIVLYHSLLRFRATAPALPARVVYGVVGMVVLMLVVVAERPSTLSMFLVSNPLPPILLATLGFMVFVFTLAKGVDTLVTHPVIRQIGVLSFSAYVLHFLFVHGFCHWRGGVVDANATGLHAIANCAALWVLVVSSTLVAAKVAHVFIEQPGIELARRLTMRRVPALAASA